MLARSNLFRVLALAILVPSLLGAAQSGLGAAYAAPSTALITGEIEQLTLTDPHDVWSGGTVVVGGQVVTLPRNLLIDFPANRLTLQQTFVGAPPECVARGESGLAKADACNTSATGALATIAANRTNGGNIIAGDVFFQKGAEVVSGVVTYINFTDGYVRLNGNAGDATTGVMVRLDDPTGRHTVQQGLGCASTAFNCSPDPRFTEDPDNYTQSFSTGFPLCIPSTVPRPFTDELDFNRNGNTTETLTARSNAAGAGDLLCPDSNRASLTSLTAADSRRLAPLLVGDHLTVSGNFETINGVHFLSAWHTTVSRALTTNGQLGQPDYMVLNEMFIDAPGFPRNRARDLFIGYTTQATSDVVIWSLHRDPATNQAHEFPLATVRGCDAAAGAGTCTNVLGPNSFVIHGRIEFVTGAKSAKDDPCFHLRSDPRFASANICPQGGTLAEELAILSPMPHEVQARTGRKMADLAQPSGPTLRTFDLTGRDAPNGQYLFPLGIGLGGIETPFFAEININALDTPYNFEGFPWNLDRRLGPGGCAGACESAPQPLEPFPFSALDPRTQAPNIPTGPYSDPNYTASTLSQASNRILSFTDGTFGPTLGQFNGDKTVLSLALAKDPPAQPVQPTPPLDQRRGLITGFTPAGGPVGTTVLVDGSGLAGVSAVRFGGVAATTFSNLSSTQVSAVVPAGAQSGPIELTTATGTVASATRFTVAAQPTISSVTPASGSVGTGLTINGSGFTSATDVAFNGTSATFTVVSDTAIRTTVPAGATSGPISVTTLGGVATSAADFTMLPADTQPPTAPADLTATGASASQVTLAWTAATDNVGVAGYHVFRDGGATPIATLSGTSFADTGLTAGTAHTYTVSAFDAAGNESAPSASAAATTLVSSDTQPPTVPTDLTATAVSASRVTLFWTASTDNVGVAGYNVFRDGGATPIATVAGTTFSDTGLAPSTTHSYTVVAFDAAGNQSPPSATASATTLVNSDTQPPTAPTDLTATAVSASQINLAWTAATDNVGVAGYHVFRDGGATPIATLTGTSFADTGLAASTAHTYTVSAFDAAGNESAPSVPASATTPVSADTQPPTVPTDLTATAVSASQINLAWTAATDNVGVAGYNVFRDGGATPIATVAGTTFSDAGLAPSTTHSYTVVAFDVAGNQSPPSATASATTRAAADTQPPTVPTNLTATAVSASQITLAWTAATDNVGVAGYDVFRDGGATPIATVAGTSFSDTGLAAGSTHSYTVLAFDAAGNQSARSVAASAATQTPPATATPTAPPAATATPAAATATAPAAPATATPPPTATSAVPTTDAPMPFAMTPTATAGRDARPRPTATKTARPAPGREQPRVTVRVPRGIISHGAPVVVSVRTRPGADTRITLRLTRQGTRCSGAARQRVCKSVTVVLAQRVVHGRANRQGLVTRSVALAYRPASPLRATLEVHVSTPYGAATHTAMVLLQPAPRARQR